MCLRTKLARNNLKRDRSRSLNIIVACNDLRGLWYWHKTTALYKLETALYLEDFREVFDLEEGKAVEILQIVQIIHFSVRPDQICLFQKPDQLISRDNSKDSETVKGILVINSTIDRWNNLFG